MKKALRSLQSGRVHTFPDTSRAIRAGRQTDLLQLDQWKKELAAR